MIGTSTISRTVVSCVAAATVLLSTPALATAAPLPVSAAATYATEMAPGGGTIGTGGKPTTGPWQVFKCALTLLGQGFSQARFLADYVTRCEPLL